MKYTLLILLIVIACLGADRPSPKQAFDEFQRQHSDRVFVPTIEVKTRAAIQAYRARARLPNGLVYGDSVRTYRLEGKSAPKVREEMDARHCVFNLDVLRDPANDAPKIIAGTTYPIWIFLCADGGVVRIKPRGDPTNAYRSHPHGSKSLRYPYDAKFENFSDEVVKVDHEGEAIPKSRAELLPTHLVDGWSADAHANLN